MQHRIGIDYSRALLKRKTKKSLPLVGRLSRTVDIEKLLAQIRQLLQCLRQEGASAGYADPASSEHNYHLKTSRGESFIRNYEEFYAQYSVIGFQDLSEEARISAAGLSFSVNDLTPSQRLRGMRNTSSVKYHPHYDERNYTKPTRFLTGYIAEVLSGFKAEACRAALVCLQPKNYISPHFDIGPEYVVRTMIPVITNSKSIVGIRTASGYSEFHLPADGGIYFINAGFEHYAINDGCEPRYQIRICLNGQDDLDGLVPLEPVRELSNTEFAQHPCARGYPNEQPAAENILLRTLREFNLEKSGKARLG